MFYYFVIHFFTFENIFVVVIVVYFNDVVYFIIIIYFIIVVYLAAV